MAASNPVAPLEITGDGFAARRIDYVSAEFIDDLCAKAAAECGSDDFAIPDFPIFIDSFFKKFRLTDVIIYKKAGRSGSRFSDACSALFKSAEVLSGLSDHSALSVPPVRYYRGVEIEADNENVLISAVRKERQNADFLAVRSADEKIIRAAAGTPDVDAVFPIYDDSQKQFVGKINHIVAKIAADKKTAFGFDIAPFLSIKGYRRSRLFSDAAVMIPILEKYNVPILLFSGASSFYDFRGPYESEAFGRLLGLSSEKVSEATGLNSAGLLQRRADLKSGKRVADGVEIVADGAEFADESDDVSFDEN